MGNMAIFHAKAEKIVMAASKDKFTLNALFKKKKNQRYQKFQKKVK